MTVWAVAIGMILVACAGAYFAGRKTGRTSQLSEGQSDDLEAYRTAQEAERGVAGLSDAGVADKLRTKWTRPVSGQSNLP